MVSEPRDDVSRRGLSNKVRRKKAWLHMHC